MEGKLQTLDMLTTLTFSFVVIPMFHCTIDAFELRCWRKLLRVTYLDKNRNTEIIDIIQPKRTLESRIVKAALYLSDTLLDQI